MRTLSLAALILVLAAPASHAQRVVFEGQPIKKAEASVDEAILLALAPEEAFKAQVRIVERNGRYYWQTRGMREMTRAESGAYITYTAVDGAGYVRTHSPMMLDLLEKLPKAQRDREIGYTEHILIQFMSLTYFGNRLPSGR